MPDWATIEHVLGTALPGDYKDYVDRLGSPEPDSFLVVYRPSANRFLDLLTMSAEWRTALGAALDAAGQMLPQSEWGKPLQEGQRRFYDRPVYPEPGGLLPWGSTENFGDVLMWETRGQPDEWPVVVANLRDGCFEDYPFGFSRFLCAWQAGTLPSEVLLSYAESVAESGEEPRGSA